MRWTLLGVVAAWIAALGLAWLLVHYGAKHMSDRTPAWLRRLTMFLDEFLEAGGELLTWRTARALVPTALYMLVYVIDLYAIMRALGIQQVSFLSTVGIYAFVVLSVILVPIPTEVGLTEFSGLMALVAYGIPQPLAAVAILALRAQGTGMTIVVASGLLFVLRHELATAASDDPAHPATSRPGTGSIGQGDQIPR